VARPTQAQAINHIEAGIRARSAAPSNLADLRNLGDLLDLQKLDRYGAEAVRRYNHVVQFYSGIETTLKAWETDSKSGLAAHARELARLPLSRAHQQKELARLRNSKRRELMNTTAGLLEDRARILGELREQARRASLAKEFFSPLEYMIRKYGAAPECAAEREALRNAGPNEIRNAIKAGIALGDNAKIVAAWQCFDGLSPEDRAHVGIGKAEVAELMAAEVCKRAQVWCRAIAYLAERAYLAHRTAHDETIASDEKLNLAIEARDLSKFFDDNGVYKASVEEPKSRDDFAASVGKIERGMVKSELLQAPKGDDANPDQTA